MPVESVTTFLPFVRRRRLSNLGPNPGGLLQPILAGKPLSAGDALAGLASLRAASSAQFIPSLRLFPRPHLFVCFVMYGPRAARICLQ